MDDQIWCTLPTHILVDIFSYVSQNDRLTLSLVCKTWSDIFHDSQLWSSFVFKFDNEKDNDGKALVCAERYSKELKKVELLVNQSQSVSCDRAMSVLDSLINVEVWKLTKFKFGFTGANPLCFHGNHILDKVKDLLRSIKDKESVFDLKELDLSRMNIALDDNLLAILSEHHQYLRVIHIQNYCLIDNISEAGFLKMVKSCKYLEKVYAFSHFVTDEVMAVFSEPKRSQLAVLSLMYNRSDKFKSIVSSDAWESLKMANPDLELIIKFHSTMPRHIVNLILCPKIPATTIDLHLYSWIDEEVQNISENCCTTLKSLSCYTSLNPNDRANPELLPALLKLVSKCQNLEELHCHCILPEETITSIRQIRDIECSTLYSEPIDEFR